MTDREPTITVSMSRKVNLERVLGPKFRYESAECFVSISGIKAGMSPEQLEALFTTGKVAWEMVREELREQIAEAIDEVQSTIKEEQQL